MPLIRFVKGVVYDKEARAPGDECEVSDKDAAILCDGYRDAVRVTGEAPKVASMTVRDQLETRDPVAEHRDPATRPSGRRR